MDKDNIFGPKKVKIVDVGINTAGAFISGVIGSVILIFIVSLTGGFLDVPGNFANPKSGFGGGSPVFPFLLSFITFIVSVIVSIITYYFLTLTDPNNYKKTIIHFGQISFFSILIYIFLAPIYVYAGMENYDYIMVVFILHCLLLSFGVTIILEVMNNYRYILLGIYASFVGLFLAGITNFFIFGMFGTGYAKLISLLLILPLVNGLTIFFKGLFEIIYYKYFIITGNDQLGDIFKQIEQEEIEQYAQRENEDVTY